MSNTDERNIPMPLSILRYKENKDLVTALKRFNPEIQSMLAITLVNLSRLDISGDQIKGASIAISELRVALENLNDEVTIEPTQELERL